MFEKLNYNEKNERILCEMNGKHSDMLMNIKVKKFQKNEKFTLCDNECETAFLILSGDVNITWDGETKNMHRDNPFVKATYCLHVPKDTEVVIEANDESEILIQQTDNDIVFTPVFYTPDMILYQHFGKDQWEGTG